jgi:hypothetical protein
MDKALMPVRMYTYATLQKTPVTLASAMAFNIAASLSFFATNTERPLACAFECGSVAQQSFE